MEGVDREERVHHVGLDPETLYEPLCLQHLKLGLVLDAGKGFGGRLVVGGLEDAAEQNRHIFEFHAGALFDCRDRLVTEKGIGAADIEHELRRRLGQGGLPGFSVAAAFWRGAAGASTVFMTIIILCGRGTVRSAVVSRACAIPACSNSSAE